MKPSTLILILAATSAAMVRADEGTNYTPKSRVVLETFTSKVIKVLSFEDGDSEYDAYVVNWKDHEVVVASMGMANGSPKYNVGDVVTCHMEQNFQLTGSPTRGRLTFSLMGGMSGLSRNPTTDPARLQAIAEEVKKRRAAREAAAAAGAPVPASP